MFTFTQWLFGIKSFRGVSEQEQQLLIRSSDLFDPNEFHSYQTEERFSKKDYKEKYIQLTSKFSAYNPANLNRIVISSTATIFNREKHPHFYRSQDKDLKRVWSDYNWVGIYTREPKEIRSFDYKGNVYVEKIFRNTNPNGLYVNLFDKEWMISCTVLGTPIQNHNRLLSIASQKLTGLEHLNYNAFVTDIAEF